MVRGRGERFALLPLVAAVAVAEITGEDAIIKWPNDVLLPGPQPGSGPRHRGRTGRKVAGILCEGRPQEGWAIVGIGVNVAVRLEDLPPDLHGTAATLGRERRTRSTPCSGGLLSELDRALALPTDALLDAWRARDGLRGRTVSWSAGTGTAAGIDGAGRLVVELPGGGRTALDAGEVHLGPGATTR